MMLVLYELKRRYTASVFFAVHYDFTRKVLSYTQSFGVMLGGPISIIAGDEFVLRSVSVF